MDPDTLLDELLTRWHERRARGEDTTPAELCRDRPDLLPELERRLDALRELPTLMATLVPPEAAAPAAPPPAVVPGYELLGELGRGGMGVVYKARHLALGRVVALKMILAGGHADEAERDRFRSEARAVARIQHPNIVQVHEVGEHEGRPFFAMEFCPGGALDKKLAATPLPPKEAARLVETLARAVHAAHQAGVVHRDLKPANVLLAADGTPKITDFGLAKRMDEMSRTQSGAVMGTPSYMAPEQARGQGKDVGPAADIYALGVILYECLTGRPPFKAATLADTLLQVMEAEPARPRQMQPHTPRDLETITLKCLEKQPARRYDTALELAEDLRRYQADEPVRARAVGPLERGVKWAQRRPALAAAYGLLLTALVLGVGGGGATWLWLRADRARDDAEKALRRAEAAEADANRMRDDVKEALGREQEAKRQLTQLSYADQVGLAQYEWQSGRAKRARNLLEQAGSLKDELNAEREPWEWDYLRRVLYPERAVLEGHTGWVLSVAFSPDGERLATASYDKTARLWDTTTGKQIAVLEGHTEPVVGVAFSPDGRWVATASYDKTARMWDAVTGKQRAVLEGHTDQVTAVAFSPDGGRLATAGGDNTARLWDVSGRGGVTPPLLAVLQGHTERVVSVAFSPDGARLITAGHDRTARLWDAATGKQLAVLRGHSGWVLSAVFSPDGSRIATGSLDGTARLWEAVSGKALGALEGRTNGAISAVAFSPDGDRIAAASGDKTARLWDVSGRAGVTPPLLAVFQGHADIATSVAFSPDGERLATGSLDGTARLWDAAGGQRSLVLEGHTGWVHGAAFSPDGRRVATASADNTARLWDAASGKPLLTLEGHTEPVVAVAFSPDGARIATASGDKTARLWDAVSGKQIAVLEGHTEQVVGVAFSPDGGRLATASYDKTARLWDVSGRGGVTPPLLAVLEGHTDYLHGVAFSPDGRRLATAGYDGTARLWDVSGKGGATPPLLAVLRGHSGWVQGVAFSPNGGRLATAGSDETARLWDAATGAQLAVLEGHTEQVVGVAFSPDGDRLVTASLDGTARLWDAACGRQLVVFEGHTDALLSAAFSPDGARIVTTGADQTARLWVARETAADREKRRYYWRERQAARAEAGRRWFAAAFHLGHLLASDPTDASLYARRCRAYAEQGLWAEAVNTLLQGALNAGSAAEMSSGG